MLRLSNVQVAFSGLQVLRGVDLRLGAGETVALVGESGSGKTTLGRVVLGLQPVSGGSVERDLTPLQLALVHQNPYAALNPMRTVGATLQAPLRRHRPDCDAAAVARGWLRQVGLPERADSAFPDELSGGQRQRVALARAMLLEPRLVVADEPLSGLDAALKLEMLELMNRLQGEHGVSFLFITHDLATVPRLTGARLCVLYLGRVVEEGVAAEVLVRPRHPYTQALCGAVAPADPVRARTRGALPVRLLLQPDVRCPPSGCAFHPRCVHAIERCAVELPSPEGGVACHRAGEIDPAVW